MSSAPQTEVPVGRTSSGVRDLGWSAAFLVVSRLAAVIAVPVVLHAVGSGLYSVWVLAGSLILAQGLVDLGAGAALVRFAAVAHQQGSRQVAKIVLVRGLVFYGVLSSAVLVPALVFAPEIAKAMPLVTRQSLPEASTLIRFAAVAFAISNMALVLASVLQGFGRVDSAFRAQTVSWLTYVPALWIALGRTGDGTALGIAWIVVFTVQLVILGASTRKALRTMATQAAPTPSIREMFALGIRWQISAWADFATFVLPRFLAAGFLTAGGFVAIDLSLRFGQLVAAPAMAVLPLILPRAAAAFAAGGRTGTARWAAPVQHHFVIAVILATAVAVPLSAPAISLWAGVPVEEVGYVLAGVVVVATMAHVSTGVLTSVLLAEARLRPVIGYKTTQFALATTIVPVSAWAFHSPLAVGIALSLALTVPAVLFNARASAELALPRPDHVSRRVVGCGVTLLTSSVAALVLASDSMGWAGLCLVLGLAACGLAVGTRVAAPDLYGLARDLLHRLQPG